MTKPTKATAGADAAAAAKAQDAAGDSQANHAVSAVGAGTDSKDSTPNQANTADSTHFGFQTVPRQEKAGRVAAVFSSVAARYDLMNDLMSLGVHRWWKRCAISCLNVQRGQRILDVAGGSGDLTLRLLPRLGDNGRVVLSDINPAMLQQGYDRVLESGYIAQVECIEANAEELPFQPEEFARIIMGFGLRNVTDKAKALRSMRACLQPGGKLVVLEFSKPVLPFLDKIYDQYSFKVLPWLGKHVANDEASYRYLAESIRMHPPQEELKIMFEEAGFEDCGYENLSGGIVALHWGYVY